MKEFLAGIGIASMVAAIVFAVLAPKARAQDGHAQHHEEYKTWTMPGSDMSCCNDGDCMPVRARQTIDGTWQAWVNGEWLDVPPAKILPFKAKDGRSHWCGINKSTWCFTAGEIRS